MKEQQLLEEIYAKMERFKNASSLCGRRQYLSAAAILHGYDQRLAEIFNSDENIDITELEEIDCHVDHILKNLGIKSST